MPRIPLFYTFGNHMHWVDMQWLWGAHVLPGSVKDMLHFCNETGARGNVNFDGIGYEKLAAEAPESFAALRAAVHTGQIEIAGASYGQPYGLFHGAESNARQRIFGVRTVTRLFGVRPRSFWEEEFDFFPQLPQLLCGAGFEYASLFFQWTWHTPIMPVENCSAIWWEGQDGSRLLTAPRNALNLHQWPEDFAGLLDADAWRRWPVPAIQQWLELMPSPDWMCRSELLIPPLKQLQQRQDVELVPVTLSEYLNLARPHAVVRRYQMNDVFHGMSLGKNGDHMRRLSRACEQQLLAAESLAALAGLAGRPYANWDVYPTWELEEAWRELLSAQHHDNDECEGLCGHIGMASYARSDTLSKHVLDRNLQNLAGRMGGAIAYNPLGWQRELSILDAQSASHRRLMVPPFGCIRLDAVAVADAVAVVDAVVETPSASITQNGDGWRMSHGPILVQVDGAGRVTQLQHAIHGNMIDAHAPLGDLFMLRGKSVWRFDDAQIEPVNDALRIQRTDAEGHSIQITLRIAPGADALDIDIDAEHLPRPDGGMHAGLQTSYTVAGDAPLVLRHDHPFAVSEISPSSTRKKKYPTGDWMTSPQVFEDVHNAFTGLQLVDLIRGEKGLLVLHDGSQAFFQEGESVLHLLSMYDPWDEDYFRPALHVRLRLVPHGPMSDARRWKLAQEFTRPCIIAVPGKLSGPMLPSEISMLRCAASNIAITALYREQALPAALKPASPLGPLPDIAYPHIVRLVELDGSTCDTRISLLGKLAAAFKTNLLGEIISRLDVTEHDGWSSIIVPVRAFEIITLSLDLELGRKVTRDLDAHRDVWATAHR